ncbi:serine threonine-protein kinase ulk3 [Chrysochromulina tobinii]|uniref:Serine threonine-protein kinase ulk3 n=1 Tax=Chrysochromulina tobinii TaxID=1460289 RepID=A0A0M0JWQ0_9EUKA|nr:serine threonine-protein kinase ulk3 [Chrysochromulina tobinii]|eukprot:KOO31086.1 serine threonine-protein kinase ulk3 [Chrysochromulina sp. CCMP291]
MPADPIQQAEGHASKLNELIAGSIERARANSTPVAPRAAAETPPKPAMLRQLTLEVPSLSNTVAATALLEAAFAPPLPEDLCRTRIESSCLRLVGKLGNGSFGTVYDARWYRANDIDIAGASPEGASSHTTTSSRPPRRVAVKLLHTKVLSLQVLRNLKRSIHVELCLAPHPNIVRLHGWSVEPNKGRVMLVMEYVGGGCLGTHISSGVAAQWTLDEVLNVAQHLATGVAFLHAHTPPIVHRDIKPENVLFGKLSLVAKLADFGTSRAIDDSSMTEFAVGTMLFSSPEQLRYAQYDAAVDVWALGCVFACIARGDTSPCAAVDGGS